MRGESYRTAENGPEALDGSLEVFGVGLRVTFDQIERGNRRVRKTAAQDTSDTAIGKVFGAVEFDAGRLCHRNRN